MMLTSGIVSIPCAAATEGAVQLPADVKHPSKLSGAMACRSARRKVLEHVALGHGNRMVLRKSPPLVGFNSLPVALLISPAAVATSPPMSMEAMSTSPPLGKLSTPLAHRSPRVEAQVRRSPQVEAQVVPVIQDCSWQCHSCMYEQDFVPGSMTCVMYHSTKRRLHCASQRVGKDSKLIKRTRGSGKSDCPNCHLGKRCKACLLARHEKCINDILIDAKGPLKELFL